MSVPVSQVPFAPWYPFVLHICVSISVLQIGSSLSTCMCYICYLFSFLWLTSLCMTVSRSIHFSENGTILFLCLGEWCSTVNMYHISLIHSSVSGHLNSFCVLAFVNSAAMNISAAFPSPGDLPNPEMEPGTLALQVDSLPSEPPKDRWTLGGVCLFELWLFWIYSQEWDYTIIYKMDN